MDDTIFNSNIFNENSNKKIDTVNGNTTFFNSLQNLQTLIKKESSSKELCKNHK